MFFWNSCFSHDPADVGNLISGSLPFLNPVWTFFGIAFLWDWNENWPFPVLWPLLSFSNFLQISWMQYFNSIIIKICSSSTGIPSPPLALLIVMLPKAPLTSKYRMSVSRWVITPLWLSGSWRSFLYSPSVYSCHLFLISSVRSLPFLSLIVPIFAWNVPFLLSFPDVKCRWWMVTSLFGLVALKQIHLDVK